MADRQQTQAPDAAALRAQDLSQFFPRLGRATGQAIQSVVGFDPATRAAATALGQKAVGNVAGVLGMQGVSADQLRGAEASDARFVQAAQQSPLNLGGLPGMVPASQAAQPAPTAQPAQPQVQVTQVQPLTPQQERMQALRGLEGLNMGQVERVMGVVPPRGAQMAPKDQTIEDLRQMGLAQFSEVMNDPNSSVEQVSAARQQIQALFLEMIGGSSLGLPQMGQ